MNKIKLICFDLDGVIADLCDIHFRAFNKALIYTGNQPILVNERHLFEGKPTSIKLTQLMQEGRIQGNSLKEVARLKQVYTLDLIDEGFPIYEEYKVICALDAKGYYLSCCSNSIRSTIELILRKLHLNNFITHIVSNEDVVQPKPTPECYLKAMHFWNVKPQETLIIEDSPVGLSAAIKSGAWTLAISDPACFKLTLIENFIKAIENL